MRIDIEFSKFEPLERDTGEGCVLTLDFFNIYSKTFGWSETKGTKHYQSKIHWGQIHCLFVCLVGWFLTTSSTTVLIAHGPQDRASDNFTCSTHETELKDHDFCLSWSYYTDTTKIFVGPKL